MTRLAHYHAGVSHARLPEHAMSSPLEVESTLTDRYQTTVPETVRRALGLNRRDKVHYSIRANGEVVLTRAATDARHDPVLGQFLEFLARDIASRPERLQFVDGGLMERLQSLVGHIEINLDAALPAEDE